MKPSKQQIQNEIAALTKCLAFIPEFSKFGDPNHLNVKLQIDALNGDIDTTADEFLDFGFEEQDSILEAINWMGGATLDSPSFGWQDYNPNKETDTSKRPVKKKTKLKK